MALIQWRDEYSVGVADVDHEHQQLIALINALAEDVRAMTDSHIVPLVDGGAPDAAPADVDDDTGPHTSDPDDVEISLENAFGAGSGEPAAARGPRRRGSGGTST